MIILQILAVFYIYSKLTFYSALKVWEDETSIKFSEAVDSAQVSFETFVVIDFVPQDFGPIQTGHTW